MAISVNVLGNLLKFLQRVKVDGMEAFAFVEAYTSVQNELALAQNPIWPRQSQRR